MDKSSNVLQMQSLSVAILTNIIPSYRKGFYDRLLQRSDLTVTIFCQEKIPGINVSSIHDCYPDNVEVLRFVSLKKEVIVWRALPWLKLIKQFDVVLIMGNPRIISDVILSLVLRVLNKKVILWTSARSYRGNKKTEYIRLLWSRLFKWLFLYTDKDTEYLRYKGFRKNYMLGMNNGLDQKQIDSCIGMWPQKRLVRWKKANGYDNKTLIVSSSRLNSKNNFALMVEAVTLVIKEIPNIHWCLVGDGEEGDYLKNLAAQYGVSKHITFVGELYNEEELAPYFLSSLVFVHPSAIGISIMHAFGYGLSVVVHGHDHLHGPEYVAFEDGVTGRNFIQDNVEDLTRVIVDSVRSPGELAKIRANVQIIAREQYNVDIMVDRFVKIVKFVVTDK
jgi:glycosyltransferase involved in cell wall biosynthesis